MLKEGRKVLKGKDMNNRTGNGSDHGEEMEPV
jgi:hypothetical protein